jgi:hypothetical protein
MTKSWKGFLQKAGAALALSVASCGHVYSSGSGAVPAQGDLASKFQSPIQALGFGAPESTGAIQRLYELAGIDMPDGLLSRLYPGLFSTKDRQQSGDALLQFVRDTQDTFSQRHINAGSKAGSLERWETKESEWMKSHAEEILAQAQILGFVDAVPPSRIFKGSGLLDQKFDSSALIPQSVQPYYYAADRKFQDIKGPVIVVLGARYPTMLRRCAYISTIQSFLRDQSSVGAIVLLGGARRASSVDGTPEELESIAQEFGVQKDVLTETHLIQYALRKTFPEIRVPVVVIDTAASGIARPTTKTTLEEFAKWIQTQPAITGAYIVSTQPHMLYQKAVTMEVLNQAAPGLDFEVVSPAAPPDLTSKDFLEAFASALWAKTPLVIQGLNLSISGEASALATKLYPDNSAIRYIITSSAAKQCVGGR